MKSIIQIVSYYYGKRISLPWKKHFVIKRIKSTFLRSYLIFTKKLSNEKSIAMRVKNLILLQESILILWENMLLLQEKHLMIVRKHYD